MSKYLNNKIRTLLFIAATLYLSANVISCKKFVQISPSPTITVTSNVFDKNTTATAAQLSIYAQMASYPFNIEWGTALSSDELKNYSTTNTTAIGFYANNLNAVNDGVKIGVWSPAYNFIYQANAVLEGLSNSPGVTAAVKKQLSGEAKFIRAYWYFYLVNLYGDVPIITSTDYKINTGFVRSPKAQVYQQIVTDLTDAQLLLNNNYVDATDTVITTERIRPNKWVATALLARTSLYNGDLTNAEVQATTVINNTGLFNLPGNLNSVFLKNSNEAIWQLMISPTLNYTSEGAGFILTVNPATNPGTYTTTISDHLLNSFEPTDQRKVKWVGTFTTTTTPSINYYFASKYKAGLNLPSSSPLLNTEYTMVLRLAEQYLIRSEARARLGTNLTGAIADLNIIRNRAGLPNYSGNVEQASILTAIMHEREVELFTEGHRWLDLKRTNTVDAIMAAAASQKNTSWSTFQQYYPIPIADIQNSAGKLVQNTGY